MYTDTKLNNIITFYKVYSKKEPKATYNFNYDISFNGKAFIIKDHDYEESNGFIINADTVISTLLSARLDRHLPLNDIVNL